MTTWRRTKPDADLDYRCDLCGGLADTVHWLPYVIDATQCLFACPDHDPGGYWMNIDDLFTGPEDWRYPGSGRKYTGLDHVALKDDRGKGSPAVVLLYDRIEKMRVVETLESDKV